MSGFPLYDNLIQQLPKKDLTLKQKEEFIRNISAIDYNGKELIYALIMVYKSQNVQQDKQNSLPYDGTQIQTDKKAFYNVTWNYMNFPIKLRHLLFKFLELHLKTLEEDGTRTIRTWSQEQEPESESEPLLDS